MADFFSLFVRENLGRATKVACRGLTFYTLAKVRYVHAGEQPPVAAQLAELAISERTYRTQVAELHRAVAERLEKRLREADRVAWRVLVGAA